MIANKWYCIAQTSTFDTRCSINVAFDGHDIQFSASVKYGASSINITRCIIPDGISFSIRLRESGSQWFVDITSSAKITPVVTVSDSEYWTSVNKPAAEGNIILLLTDITSKYNTSSFGGDSLFELVNVGTSDVPRYAVVPKVFQGQNPGVISRTFMTFGGLGADSNGEDDPSGVSYLRNLLDVRLSELLEDSDVLTYDKNQDLWVNKKGGFNEEKLEEYLEKYKYITEDDIKGLLVLLQWFEFDDANHAVRVKSDFNFVVPNALSFGGLGTYSGGGEGGVSYLKNLLDVQLGTLLEDGEVLVYDKHLDRWVNKSIETGLDVDSLQKYLTDNKYITSAAVDGLQGQINNNATNIALLLSWLEYDEVNKALRVKNGYNFIVDGALSFGGLGEDDNPTPGGLTQVTIQLGNNPNDSYVSENGKVILPAYPVIPTLLSAFENDKGYLVVSDLDGYAKLTDIPSVEGFALAEDLNTLSKQIEGYDNKFADVGESILDIEEDISKLAPLDDLEKLEEAVNPLFGYFDANGSANNALKLGGQLPSYYATVDTLNLVKNDITAVSNRVQKFEDVIGIDSNGDVYIKGTRNFYTAGGTIGMAGLGSGGSGGGGAAGIVTVRVNGYDYNSVNGIVTLPNYPSLAGYATEKWVTSRGYITGITSAMVTSALGYTPYNSASFTKANIKSTLGIADWALAATLALADVPDLSSKYAAVGLAGSSSYVALKNGGYIAYSGGDKWSVTNSDWTAVYGILHSNNYGSYALPLSGGTINGSLLLNTGEIIGLTINRTNSKYSVIHFQNSENGDVGYLGVIADETPVYLNSGGSVRNLIHSGNIGSQSVDRAIALRGIYPSGTSTNDFYNTEQLIKYHAGFSPDFGNVPSSNSWQNGLMEIGLHSGGASAQFFFSAYKRLYYRSHQTDAWHGVAYLTDNVASATKLQTARTIWGQSFDGTGNVDGCLTLGGLNQLNQPQIKFSFNGEYFDLTGNFVFAPTSGSWSIFNESSANPLFRVLKNGNVLIGATTDNGAKLQVNGDINANSFSSNPNDYFTENNKNIPWYGLSVVDGYNKGVYLTGYSAVYIKSAYAYIKLDYNGLYISGNLTVTGDIISEGTMAMAKLASSSDRSLKDNIAEVSAEQSMSIIRQLRPTTWNWKKDGKKSYGFIAQEVEPIVPEMVSCINDTLRLEYNQLHAFEIGAIQHIDSEVEMLKRRVNELENELKQYRRNA